MMLRIAIVMLFALLSVPVHARAQEAAAAPRRSVGMGIEGDENGVAVSLVVPGSPAEKAGLKLGDKVISIAGIAIFDLPEEKMRALADTAKTIAIVVMRGKQKMTLTVEPAVMNLPTRAPAEGAPR